MRMDPFPTVVIAVFLVLLFPVSSSALSASQVVLDFMCPCGTCSEALSTCECPASDKYRALVSRMVGQGRTEQQIVDYFVGQWGSSVLVTSAGLVPGTSAGSSSKKSFGFILVIIGVSLAAFTAGKYFRTSSPPPPPGRGPSSGKGKKGSSRGRKPANRRSRGRKKGFSDGVDDDLLDDYIHE
ncbi:MAG TPA: hypothetical protein ENH32_01360 [Proteobacteria bacterium]|nr:cytochrome C biogenesis protein [bacterium BMS3Abin14]HDL52602.1 hypothetical protein [Pseudomonadota bacterium]